jgi:integrase
MKDMLSESIESFLSFRKSQDFSKGTLRNDTSILKRFLAEVGNIYTHNVTDRHVTIYFERVGRTRKPSALRNDHYTLLAFFAWARQTKRLPMNADPMYGRRVPKPVKRERHRIHVSKFPYLLDVAGERDPRDRALIAVLLYTLLRDRDAADLRVRDVDLDAGYLTAVISKVRREDRMPISLELDQELRRWLTTYGEAVGGLRPDYYLIPCRHSTNIVRDGERGRILSHDFAYDPLKRIGQGARIIAPLLAKVGVPLKDPSGDSTGEGAHTLRRSGARALFDELNGLGYDHSLRVVQSMLHHASQTTTEGYIGITADRRTRDDLIRGRRMYASAGANVVPLAVGGSR